MSEIKSFNKQKVRAYPTESELARRINDLVHEYDGEVSLVSVLGVLEMIKAELLLGAFDEE